jgi:carbonic anhydrase
MDSRLDPLRDLGLDRGDAMVLRNGGATLSDDMERSLRIAHENLGVAELWLVGHTDCAAHGGDMEAVRGALRDGERRIGAALPGFKVRTLVYDLATGRAEPPA